MYTIYQKTNSLNGKSYIGFTTVGVVERWNTHLENAKYGNPGYLYNAIRKYGPDVFVENILKQGNDEEWGLKVEEPFYIALYRTNTPQWGYNMTAGGEGILGYKHTEKTIRSASIRMKGICSSQLQTPEAREKSRIKQTGVSKSPAHCLALSISHKGKITPPNVKLKQSLKQWGIPKPQPHVKCLYCGVEGGANVMKRWHFDRCKEKETQ